MARMWSKGVLGGLLLAAVLALACATERGLEPTPANYRLYVAKTGDAEGWVAVVDCASDSVVDTLRYGFQHDGIGVVASPDGKYLAVTGSGRPPLIWDVVGRTPIGYLSSPIIPPLFLPDAELVVGTHAPYESTLVFSAPALAPRRAWPVGLVWAQRIPKKPHVMGVDFRGLPPPGDDGSKLAIFDYRQGSEIDSVIIEPNDEGMGVQVAHFTLSSDGRRLYVIGSAPGGRPSLIGYDLQCRQVIFRQPSHVGRCRATPDGREVWVLIHGFLWESPIPPGFVIVFDAHSGNPLDTIKSDGLGPRPGDGLSVLDARFLPSGETAYVNTFDGPVLVIDTRTHAIEKSILSTEGAAQAIDLAPAP
ncbi:MAG: hypothetical protein AB1792_00755 [Candidatus Zixiibacteriota bacterium]